MKGRGGGEEDEEGVKALKEIKKNTNWVLGY